LPSSEKSKFIVRFEDSEVHCQVQKQRGSLTGSETAKFIARFREIEVRRQRSSLRGSETARCTARYRDSEVVCQPASLPGSETANYISIRIRARRGLPSRSANVQGEGFPLPPCYSTFTRISAREGGIHLDPQTCKERSSISIRKRARKGLPSRSANVQGEVFHLDPQTCKERSSISIRNVQGEGHRASTSTRLPHLCPHTCQGGRLPSHCAISFLHRSAKFASFFKVVQLHATK
jgi:hypothetical protein